MNFVTGSVRAWLRIEGIAVLTISVLFYRDLGASWIVFAVLFLVPDLSMLGYLGGSRSGAAIYNIAHTYIFPLALLGIGVFAGHRTAAACALIWIAHIGFDRLLGYGLKYPTAFGETHLGMIGKARSRQ
jgi:hypothetical protein